MRIINYSRHIFIPLIAVLLFSSGLQGQDLFLSALDTGGKYFSGRVIKVDSTSIVVKIFDSAGGATQETLAVNKNSVIQDTDSGSIALSKITVNEYVHGYYSYSIDPSGKVGSKEILSLQRGIGSTPGGKSFSGIIAAVDSISLQALVADSSGRQSQISFKIDQYSVIQDINGAFIKVSSLAVNNQIKGYYYLDINSATGAFYGNVILKIQRTDGSDPGGKYFSGRVIQVSSASVIVKIFSSAGYASQETLYTKQSSIILDASGNSIALSNLTVNGYIHGYYSYYIDSAGRTGSKEILFLQNGIGSVPGGKSFSGTIVAVDSISLQAMVADSSGRSSQVSFKLDQYSVIQDVNGAFIKVSNLSINNQIKGYYYLDINPATGAFYGNVILKILRTNGSDPGGKYFSGRVIQVSSASVIVKIFSSAGYASQETLYTKQSSIIQDASGNSIALSNVAVDGYVNGYYSYSIDASGKVGNKEILYLQGGIGSTPGGISFSGMIVAVDSVSLKAQVADSSGKGSQMSFKLDQYSVIQDVNGAFIKVSNLAVNNQIKGYYFLDINPATGAFYGYVILKILRIYNPSSGTTDSIPGELPKSVILACDSARATAGSTATVSISLNNSSTLISGGQFVITPEPPEILTFKNVTATGRITGWTVADNASNEGRIILFYSASGATISTGSEAILSISYDINSNAPEGLSITLALYNAQISNENQQAVSVSLINGKITIGGCTIPGDVNSDGAVNIFDVLLIVKYALGQSVPTTQEKSCADMNMDGAVNIFDVLICVNKALGKTVTLAGHSETDLSRIDMKKLALDLKALGGDQALIDDITKMLSEMIGNPRLPKSFDLSQNAPNPFNPSTAIRYDVPEGKTTAVSIRVYDLRGRLVKILVEDFKEPGTYTVFWDGMDEAGRKLSSGVYIYHLKAGNFVKTRKMILLK